MRIVFAGTPDFAVPALKALCAAGHQVAAVYTQPDRPAGRGRKLTSSPIKQTALDSGLSVEQPQSFRDADAVAQLRAHAPDVMVVAAYGLILPAAVLQTPPQGCINIHASLLPRWRGAAPIQRAIIAGDAVSGISIMQMNEGLDTGAVYSRVSTPIAVDETGGSLHDRLADMGADAIVQVIAKLEQGGFSAQAQDNSAATYARKIEKSEARLDWARPAIELERRVRAFNPWPIAETRWRDDQLRVWAARALGPGDIAEPGRVLRATGDGIVVACGDGSALSLDSVQVPGGRAMSAAAFLNSHDLRDAVLG